MYVCVLVPIQRITFQTSPFCLPLYLYLFCLLCIVVFFKLFKTLQVSIVDDAGEEDAEIIINMCTYMKTMLTSVQFYLDTYNLILFLFLLFCNNRNKRRGNIVLYIVFIIKCKSIYYIINICINIGMMAHGMMKDLTL